MDRTPAEQLRRLLAPRHIAVFGGEPAAEVIRQCQAMGFPGDLFAVNPGRDELAGVPCHAQGADLPVAPDASFIAVPATHSIALIHGLAMMGAGAAVCYASGFGETGERGRALEQRLAAAAHGIALVGPNCYGVLNYFEGAALWPDAHGGRRVDSGVAIVSQSGNLALNMTLARRGLDLGVMVSVGNCATLQAHDYVEALSGDPRVRAIGLYIESLREIAAFADAARIAAERGKPIVVLRTGRSQAGACVTLSHTGALAGEDSHYQALFSRLGVAECRDVEEFLETLKFLSIVGPLPGNRLASMSCSGGEASLVADLAEPLELDLPEPNANTAAALHAVLGERVNIGNPLDYHTYIWGKGDAQQACFGAMMGEEFDITALLLDYPPGDPPPAWSITEQAFLAAMRRYAQPAAVISTLPENLPEQTANRLAHAGIAPMLGVSNALRAIRAAAWIGANWKQEHVSPIATGEPPTAPNAVDELTAKRLLARFGIATPNAIAAGTGDALAAAERIGYPVALKVLDAAIAHKTECGAVALDLTCARALTEALERMSPLGTQFLVEAMAPGPLVELLVGVVRDPRFGLLLTVGAGGVFAELQRDCVTVLLPANDHTLMAALASLRLWPRLNGWRGAAHADLPALLHAIRNIAAFAADQDTNLGELDINPLFVYSKGQGCLAVDALLTLGDPSGGQRRQRS